MKVSVVTPSYNQAQFIERTIQSVLEQDIPLLEFVVFDGGSSDGTLEVLKRYEDRLKWISRPDKGQADAVNQGIQATDGEIIGWLNSDDVYYPGCLSDVVKVFADNPDVDVVYGMADHVDVDNRRFDVYPTAPWDFEWLKCRCFICQPALFFRRSVVERFGLLDPALMYCMDYEYWLRIAQGGARFLYLPRKLAASRMYPENKTLRDKLAVRNEINDMLHRRLGWVPDCWLYVYAQHMAQMRADEQRSPKRHRLNLAVQLLLAALRWNRGVSTEMTQAFLGRIAGRRTLLSLHAIENGQTSPLNLTSAFPEGGELSGVYRDGWAGPSMTVRYGAGRPGRFIGLELGLPQWLPAEGLRVTVSDNKGQLVSTYQFARGDAPRIHLPLGAAIGRLDFRIHPSFRPNELAEFPGTLDVRELTLKVHRIDAGVPEKITSFFPQPERGRPSVQP